MFLEWLWALVSLLLFPHSRNGQGLANNHCPNGRMPPRVTQRMNKWVRQRSTRTLSGHRVKVTQAATVNCRSETATVDFLQSESAGPAHTTPCSDSWHQKTMVCRCRPVCQQQEAETASKRSRRSSTTELKTTWDRSF